MRCRCIDWLGADDNPTTRVTRLFADSMVANWPTRIPNEHTISLVQKGQLQLEKHVSEPPHPL
jgi:hypothetical protein